MWQIRQIEAFAAVVKEGGLTRAAEKLHISQPAVSKLVSSLERSCGFKLFHRNGNRLTMTAEGDLLFAEVQQMMVSTEEIRNKAEEIREKRFGSLHVAAFPALSAHALPTIVSDFIRMHPGVRPLVTSRSSSYLIDWVTAQRSDLGVALLAQERPGLAFTRILEVEGVCVLPPNHRLKRARVIRPSDIDREPFISLSTNDRSRFLVEEFFRGREHLRNIVAEMQMSQGACQMVTDGTGVSIVEPFSAMSFAPGSFLIKRIEPKVYFDVWLMYPTHRPMSKIAAAFARFLHAELERRLTEFRVGFQSFPMDLDQT
ncbi:HTH-type transcriptional activator CmpR [Pandoraea eparura]|uniref:HTH-type transcriptional activator CmpR n=1 Tax=Pandoraea eparura TaxID=2508291 RepID=A0A5E4RFR2_9BURK|nr:LysR substrate-binding domain-containing protein [Pandoraea eparura]VVD60788.1 HTH-type transcriptional activator CmpR [Pandoraea eparura]